MRELRTARATDHDGAPAGDATRAGTARRRRIGALGHAFRGGRAARFALLGGRLVLGLALEVRQRGLGLGRGGLGGHELVERHRGRDVVLGPGEAARTIGVGRPAPRRTGEQLVSTPVGDRTAPAGGSGLVVRELGLAVVHELRGAALGLGH
jgi:hypothetical protein